MKKTVFVVLLLLISFGVVEKLSARSLQSTEDKFEIDEHQELTIKQAIELAYPSALKWDEKLFFKVKIYLRYDSRLSGSGH